MWTRAELKERAKAALHRNYWKIVLVSSLLLLLGCGAGGYFFQKAPHNAEEQTEAEDAGIQAEMEEAGELEEIGEMEGAGELEVFGEMEGTGEPEGTGGMEETVVVIVIFTIIFLFFFVVILAADIFLINPLDVGGKRFMMKSVENVAQVKEIAYGFDHSYKNVVKVLFYRDLYVLLWALLLVIPGIVKMYQYYMVPYILTENPDMEYRAALDKSREMMEGNKWKTFVLGLSFILWDFLGALTFGIVEVFYVQPYRHLTFAALYRELKDTAVINSEDRYGI